MLDKTISPDQTGHVKRDYIGTNIRKVLDTIKQLSTEQKTGILFFLDFEKAFVNDISKFNFDNQFFK